MALGRHPREQHPARVAALAEHADGVGPRSARTDNIEAGASLAKQGPHAGPVDAADMSVYEWCACGEALR